jgi:hypothetical protein
LQPTQGHDFPVVVISAFFGGPLSRIRDQLWLRPFYLFLLDLSECLPLEVMHPLAGLERRAFATRNA